MIGAKLPAALFITAGLIVGVGLLRRDTGDATPALPDPAEMAANGYGYEPLDDVVAMWEARIEQNGDDYLSRTRLGTSLLGLARETGDLTLYERAEAELRAALAVAPAYGPAQTGLAGALSAQHEFAAALTILEAVGARNPQDAGVRAAIADAHVDLGDYDAAFALFDELAVQLPDNPASLSRLARRSSLTGDNERAIELARAALIASSGLDLRPSEAAGAWFQLAYFQYQAGHVDDAEQTLRSGLSIDEGHLPSRELLGKVLVAQGRLADAAALYEDLVTATPAADLHGLLGEIYRAEGRDAEAAEQFRSGQAVLEAQIGRFPAERRHLAGFVADIDHALFLRLMRDDTETRRDVYGLDLLAWAQYLNGDTAGAEATMDEALALGTVDATMLFHAGMIAVAAGDADAGRRQLEAALDLNPGFDLGDVALAETTLASL